MACGWGGRGWERSVRTYGCGGRARRVSRRRSEQTVSHRTQYARAKRMQCLNHGTGPRGGEELAAVRETQQVRGHIALAPRPHPRGTRCRRRVRGKCGRRVIGNAITVHTHWSEKQWGESQQLEQPAGPAGPCQALTCVETLASPGQMSRRARALEDIDSKITSLYPYSNVLSKTLAHCRRMIRPDRRDVTVWVVPRCF